MLENQNIISNLKETLLVMNTIQKQYKDTKQDHFNIDPTKISEIINEKNKSGSRFKYNRNMIIWYFRKINSDFVQPIFEIVNKKWRGDMSILKLSINEIRNRIDELKKEEEKNNKLYMLQRITVWLLGITSVSVIGNLIIGIIILFL